MFINALIWIVIGISLILILMIAFVATYLIMDCFFRRACEKDRTRKV